MKAAGVSECVEGESCFGQVQSRHWVKVIWDVEL